MISLTVISIAQVGPEEMSPTYEHSVRIPQSDNQQQEEQSLLPYIVLTSDSKQRSDE